MKTLIKNPETENIIGEIEVGKNYYEDAIKNYAKSKGTDAIRNNNTMIGETTIKPGRISYSFYLKKKMKNAWFIFIGYSETSKRVYKCVYYG